MQGQETTTTTTPLKPTRASFIRGLPESMPVAEVIERGREAGIEINPTDVHSARYYMRQAAGLPPAPGSYAPPSEQAGALAVPAKRDPAKEPPKPSGAQYITRRTVEANVPAKTRAAAAPPPRTAAKPRAKVAVRSTDSMEEQLRLIVMRIGSDRAREIIEEVEELALRE
jgi:hypothetical protein